MSEKAVVSYRVSMFETFVNIAWWLDRPDLPPLWSLWDCALPSLRCLEFGRGEPPARHFPTGVVPDFRAEQGR